MKTSTDCPILRSNSACLAGERLVRTKRSTKSSVLLEVVSTSQIVMSRGMLLRCSCTDIASISKKVVTFYKQKGGEVVSPLIKAF